MKFYIARDFDGGLYTFTNKPWLQTVDKIWLDYPIYIDWKDENSYFEQLDCNLFPEITFENSPQVIEKGKIYKMYESKVDANYGDNFYYCECYSGNTWDAWLFKCFDDGEGNVTSYRFCICCGPDSVEKFPKIGEYSECEYFYYSTKHIIQNEIDAGKMRNLRKATLEEIEFMIDFLKTEDFIYHDLFKMFLPVLSNLD